MSRVLFRIAAVLMILLGLGHTAGYPWSDPAWGVDLGTIRLSHFDVLGSHRSYWDFYVGFGLSISVLLLPPALVAWQLGSREAARGRGTAWCLAAVFLAITVVDCLFFFVVPIAFSGAITLCLAAAALSMRSAGAPSGAS